MSGITESKYIAANYFISDAIPKRRTVAKLISSKSGSESILKFIPGKLTRTVKRWLGDPKVARANLSYLTVVGSYGLINKDDCHYYRTKISAGET